MSDIPVQPLPEFARMFAVSGAQVGWLFGAGTSASGGIPTAGQLLDEFKAVLYASENNLDQREVRMGDPLVSERVRRFFDDAHGLPPIDSPDEYAAAFERTYPDPAVRRQWLDRWIARGRPSFGHRVVAALLASGLARWLATTNFDDLVERGYEQLRARTDSLQAMTVAAIDSAERAPRALRENDWPLTIKLHGDIKSERLKNTSAELQAQDETLRQALVDASRAYGLAVIGYSGRDTSVMDTLRQAIANKGAFPSGLCWLTSDPTSVFPAVSELLREARAAGVDARFVESANFDESFGVLARHVDLSGSLSSHVAEGRPKPHVRGVEIDNTQGGQFPALRMNALPVIELPKTAIHVRCKKQIDQRPGLLLRESDVSLFGDFGVASGRDFYGYGLTNIWQQALARYEPEIVEEVEIPVRYEALDLVTVGLLNEAVVRALAWDRPLRGRFTSRGHRIVVWPDDTEETTAFFEPLVAAYGGALTGTFEGERTWRESVRIRLDWRLDRVWLLFEPWTWVDRARDGDARRGPRSRFAAPDSAAVWVKERWVTRRNEFWASAIGAWADLLVPGETATVSAPQIDNSRLVAAELHDQQANCLQHAGRQSDVDVPMTTSAKLPPYRVLAEPLLLFGDGRQDARHLHPLRGLLDHGPYSKSAFATFRDQVRIATICPEDTQNNVFSFLKSLQDKHEPRERKNYLPIFPGFEKLFGVPIHGAAAEAHIKLAADTVTDAEGDMAQLGTALRKALDQLLLKRDQFDVVAIHLPDRWQPGFEDLDSGLDLHHEVKSIAAVAGVPTQFLNDRALTYFDRCSVAWRLSIAQYVKAGGTPWRLVPATADTAYVGLSYAFRGERYVTCCSQVFDADGGGMEFVAYDVGDGLDFDNPFLTRGDMRAVMTRSLAVYQERNAGRFPRRVVIHKTQPFKEDEIDGCFDAWGRSDEIECVQVIASNDWRAVRLLAPKSAEERSTPDSWPVERGTLVPFSDRSILLFLNGDAPTVATRGHFVQGGKGIPRPVTLVRHAGTGPLELLGDDALALSKMNWNNDALFDSLPVTIEYSQRLSRTIARATSLPSGVYPYRLFM